MREIPNRGPKVTCRARAASLEFDSKESVVRAGNTTPQDLALRDLANDPAFGMRSIPYPRRLLRLQEARPLVPEFAIQAPQDFEIAKRQRRPEPLARAEAIVHHALGIVRSEGHEAPIPGARPRFADAKGILAGMLVGEPRDVAEFMYGL